MTPQYRVLPGADRDLDDQADYLARAASLDTALRFYDAARTTFERITELPSLGERRESSDPRLSGLRVWRVQGFEKHLIFYRPIEGGIEIVRVLHGARDIDRWLESGDDAQAGAL